MPVDVDRQITFAHGSSKASGNFELEKPESRRAPVVHTVPPHVPWRMPVQGAIEQANLGTTDLTKGIGRSPIDTQPLFTTIRSTDSIGVILNTLTTLSRLGMRISEGSDISYSPQELIIRIQALRDLAITGSHDDFTRGIKGLPTAHGIQKNVENILIKERQAAMQSKSAEAAKPTRERNLRLPGLNGFRAALSNLMQSFRG